MFGVGYIIPVELEAGSAGLAPAIFGLKDRRPLIVRPQTHGSSTVANNELTGRVGS